MNKKFLLNWLIVFVVWMFASFIVHAILLHPDYLKLPALYRSEQDSAAYFPFMLFAHLLMAGALTWIYARGVEDKPWLAQGLRFGLLAACLIVIPWYLIYYAVQPLPGMLVAKQIIFDGTAMLILGIVLGALHRHQVISPASSN